MLLAPDIEQKIREDAGDAAGEIRDRLAAYAARNPETGDRILRCLVHIAAGKTGRLEHAIRTAESDWRDIIVQAEYEPQPGTKRFQGDWIQVRDFNLPFS